MDFKQYLEIIEKKLQNNFDIEKNYKVGNYEFDLFAEYHLRTERYILLKKTVLDAIENNEYCFIKYFDNLTQQCLQTYINILISFTDEIVNPDESHMSSMITGVIVLDEQPNMEIIDTIKKFKYQKGFAFGFKGWVDIRLILVTMNDEYIVTSKKGKEVREVYGI
ncbi:hypothetical protein K8M07_04530 [Schnuerera sp. xch1]|uniref:hypothetical protein n=1 Tax=Schnuerera sp. xch1 TaxID=2874283 RepID=UPI001CBE15D9|nr:hypothetical protein [Schnuerera sp. xch1]MBZ2174507.1 hypothetical protein [Schnuerera sp. xch1]